MLNVKLVHSTARTPCIARIRSCTSIPSNQRVVQRRPSHLRCLSEEDHRRARISNFFVSELQIPQDNVNRSFKISPEVCDPKAACIGAGVGVVVGGCVRLCLSLRLRVCAYTSVACQKPAFSAPYLPLTCIKGRSHVRPKVRWLSCLLLQVLHLNIPRTARPVAQCLTTYAHTTPADLGRILIRHPQVSARAETRTPVALSPATILSYVIATANAMPKRDDCQPQFEQDVWGPAPIMCCLATSDDCLCLHRCVTVDAPVSRDMGP